MWFLLDGSPSTSDEEFDAVMNFSSYMASLFNISTNRVQLGLSIYSHKHEIMYNLTEKTDLTKFQAATKTARKTSGFLLKYIIRNGFVFGFGLSYAISVSYKYDSIFYRARYCRQQSSAELQN